MQVPFKARYFDDDVQVVAVRQVLLMTVKVDVVSLNESPLSPSLQIKEQIVLIKKNYFTKTKQKHTRWTGSEWLLAYGGPFGRVHELQDWLS